MFGYLMISNKNEVVIVDGDADFKRYLWTRIDKEINTPMEVASTSSGVFSDSADSIPAVLQNRKCSSSQFSLREITHIFLPIITLYRSSSHTGAGAFELSFSEESIVRFRQLTADYFIIAIGNNDFKQCSFLEYFQFGLHINLGPLLSLIDSELQSVKNGKDNVLSLLSRHLKGNLKRTRDFLDVRRASYYKTKIEKIMPMLKSVSNQLHLFVGSNRCLVMSKGDVIASVNSVSDDKHIWKQLYMPDLHCLLDQLDSLPTSPMRVELSQVWMRSTHGIIPYYVNVIRCRLTEHLILICLSETKLDCLIRIVVLLLKQLENVHRSDNLEQDLVQISQTMEEMVKGFGELINISKDTHGIPFETSFLRKPVKTGQFFKNVWYRLRDELLRSTETEDYSTKINRRFTIGSIRSMLSTFSLNSTTSIKNNNGRKGNELPMKVDTLLLYLQRQVTILIQELCSYSQKEAQQFKLPLFQDSIRRIFRPTHEKMMYTIGIGDSKDEDRILNYLRPVDQRLDMVAYSFCNNERKLCMTYLPDTIRKEIESVDINLNSTNFVGDITGTSFEKYSVYKIKTEPSKTNLIKSLWKSSSHRAETIPPGITITAIFPSYVHRELAFAQITKLTNLLHVYLLDVSKLYC